MTFAEFLGGMRRGDVVPRPADEPWDDMIARIHVEGRVAEIDQETFDWYLECLPPFHVPCIAGGFVFAFAEGAEAIKFFWRDRQSKRYFVRQFTSNETYDYCYLAGIPLPY